MQTETFKTALLAQRRDLSSRASRNDIAIEPAPDAIDSVQNAAERDLAITSLSLHWNTLRAIEAALVRVDDGSFGVCRNCEEPIAARRLKAIPSAELCIRCQEARDREVPAEAARFYLGDAAA